MSPNRDPSNISPWQYAANSKVLLVGGEVGCLTLIIVLASVFGGLWLDNLFGTKPLITIILVLASAPFSLVLTIWIAKRAVKDINTLPVDVEQDSSSQNAEGETTGE
jgi:F0F1-type ATP synthase assembly protein I